MERGPPKQPKIKKLSKEQSADKATQTKDKEKPCKVLLPISSQVVHKNILRDFGECCESVPLDRPGSYISISIKIYITIILARVVQVDAFLL